MRFLSLTADPLVTVAGGDHLSVPDHGIGTLQTVEPSNEAATPGALEAPDGRLVEVVDLRAVMVVDDGAVSEDQIHDQSSKNGKNALDFHIAYFLGVLREQDVAAGRRSICIVVTGDGGFDALFDLMRGQGCAVDKAASIPEALALAARMQAQAEKESETKATEDPVPPRATLTEEDVSKIVAGFVADPKSRPASRKKLEPYVQARLGNKVTPAVAQAVVKQLIKRGLVTFDGEKIRYPPPAAT